MSDGLLTDSESIAITVSPPDPGDTTGLSGRVLDADDLALGVETPVVGVSVSLVGQGATATTAADASFSIASTAAGPQVVAFGRLGHPGAGRLRLRPHRARAWT